MVRVVRTPFVILQSLREDKSFFYGEISPPDANKPYTPNPKLKKLVRVERKPTSPPKPAEPLLEGDDLDEELDW